MLESLSEKLVGALGKITSRGTLSENDIKNTVREVRLALLEADVDYGVARAFTESIREKATGKRVFGSLTPGQTLVKIVHEELAEILGGKEVPLVPPEKIPTVIMLAGLQGSGKTSAAAKLARFLKRKGRTVVMAACDLQRPAAIEQLKQLGADTQTPVYSEDGATSPVKVAKAAVKFARNSGAHYVILDTAGRQATDADLMRELAKLHSEMNPDETLLTLDAMTGQDAIRSATVFHESVDISGIVLTKMDGDARGGATLSLRSKLGIPVKFVTIGERPHQIEEYHPARLASRILGMGDVESLVEKAQAEIDEKEAKKTAQRLSKGRFDMNDFLKQLETVKKMGPMSEVLGMMPGMGKASIKNALKDGGGEKRVGVVEAVILSMTPQERAKPEIIKGSRRQRIAKGSGTSLSQVNQVLSQHTQMKKMFKRLKGSKNQQRSLASLFK